MKQQGISATIDGRFNKIEVLVQKVINGFDVEAIHEFRTEIKKLRASFRLLNVEIGKKKLRLSKEIKTLYDYAGTIRNLQLQLVNMQVYSPVTSSNVIEIYIEYLKKIVDKWKEHIIGSGGFGKNFNHNMECEYLPRKLRRSSVKKFVQDKMNELACLLSELPNDDVLHAIRKVLKDVFYNWTFIKQDRELLPPGLSKKEEIKSLTEVLGRFMDKSIGIILLETFCKDCEENGIFYENEIGELQDIESSWKREKQELLSIIYLNPGLQSLCAPGR
ncbi:MAG: CHAD domain-containing protein [Ginsengibacter sp.]